jgi:predicted short-subunit dehydrogenase-like oxidoreductase (DUF2520 family)
MPGTASKTPVKIAIVGPGRLGTALAIALSRCNYQISALVGRRAAQIKRSAKFLEAPVQILVAKEIKLLSAPDLILVTAPDEQIPTVVNSLAKIKIARKKFPIVLHTSGALSSSILKRLREQGWSVGSIHPLISVSEPNAGANDLEGCYWCVEGDVRAQRISRSIVRDLKGHSFSIAAEMKPLYHAAAVMSSGNVVALFDVAIDMLNVCGLERDQAQKVLLPLLTSTLKNLANGSPAKSLTGTFSRGDLATLNRHLIALKDKRLVDAESLYRQLGRKAVSLAAENGLDPSVVKLLESRLKNKR